mgnify:CR=1 FL=1
MALSTEYAEQLAIHEENRDEPIVYFVLPCYNEAEGLRHTAEVLHHKFDLLVASKKMISFAIQGITSFSTKPLSFVTGVGGIIGLGRNRHIRLCHGVINGGACDGGWGSLMCSIWLIGGFIMISLGIVGECVGKIYLESKHCPRYHIETML